MEESTRAPSLPVERDRRAESRPDQIAAPSQVTPVDAPVRMAVVPALTAAAIVPMATVMEGSLRSNRRHRAKSPAIGPHPPPVIPNPPSPPRVGEAGEWVRDLLRHSHA